MRNIPIVRLERFLPKFVRKGLFQSKLKLQKASLRLEKTLPGWKENQQQIQESQQNQINPAR